MYPSDITPSPTVEQLRYIVNNYPIIDHHTSNLILPAFGDAIPFESITSEAQGRALRDVPKSLAHLRASRQLRQLYECSDDADWADILEQRLEWLKSNPERLSQRCFEGVHALLVDDGMPGPDRVYPYDFHDRYMKAPSKRIVRIETVAESLMQIILRDVPETALDHASFFTDTWVTFTEEFEREIIQSVQDPSVAGFKSVICYRSGLDIEPDYQQAAQEVAYPFERYVERCLTKKKFRINRKPLNDYLVLRTLEVLSEQLTHPEAFSKPFQLHTGLGDNDISLLQSSPAYLQPLIEGYSKVPFVLLHASYPYTREASYLATVYKHVYLDLGGVFPMLSKDGQKTVLRESLEIVPGSKLLFSSSGRVFPETFWLSNRQFREVLLELAIEYINNDDITPHQAISLTKDILFNNSNVLYDLRYEAVFNEVPLIQGQIAYESRDEPVSAAPMSSASNPPTLATGINRTASRTPEGGYEPPPFPPPPKEPQVYDAQLLDRFLAQHENVKYVYVQWLDYLASIRSRIVPIKEFYRMIRSGSRIKIPSAKIGMLQHESIPIRQIYVEADLRSLRRTHEKDSLPSATVLCFWRDESGRPIRECPRTNLEHLVDNLKYNHNIALLCGFEIDVTFLSRNPLDPEQPYSPIMDTNAQDAITPEQWIKLPFLPEIVSSLSGMDIELQQFHAESGPGQYKFILSPQSPLAAIDSLLQARQVIHQLAALHGWRATLHPQPFAGINSAACLHISIDPPSKDMQFFANGIAHHLASILAFTMPEAESYRKIVDDPWTTDKWHTWEQDDINIPLQRISPGQWDIRCMDGFANAYLALSAIIAAGSLGLVGDKGGAGSQDAEYESSHVVESKVPYEMLGELPETVEEAMQVLGEDEDLQTALPEGLVEEYLLSKKRDQEISGQMEASKRRVWLIERY
ncbi:unnamed protein product [Periconia digitata]|uniref:GS catalytic domain-containing protein n=1 Tax=Periconia digitata TaxID=1303443 RepID=A0A9W4UP39_9PLEO|nr:unnamed protein product [Periconia digitata]